MYLYHSQHLGNSQGVPSHTHKDSLAFANGHWQRVLRVNLEGDAGRLESPISLRPTNVSQMSTVRDCLTKCMLAKMDIGKQTCARIRTSHSNVPGQTCTIRRCLQVA